jgi:hypothetical protein
MQLHATGTQHGDGGPLSENLHVEMALHMVLIAVSIAALDTA